MGFEDFINAAEPWDPPGTALRQAFAPVRLKNSEQIADGALVQNYLKLALESSSMVPSADMAAIRETLNEDDLQALVRGIFAAWVKEPDKESRKGVFLLWGLHAGDEDVARILPEIKAWLDKNKDWRETALDAVLALSLSRSELAPMVMDAIGRRTQNEKVREAAREILGTLMQSLNITADELQDYIVPSLSFDDFGQREIVAGESRFTAMITPDLKLKLLGPGGAPVEVPPEPESADDTAGLDMEGFEDEEAAPVAAKPPEELKLEMVGGAGETSVPVAVNGFDGVSAPEMAAVFKQFCGLQKALETVVKVQSRRLRLFMLVGRNWDRTLWERLFKHNPILHKFCTTLVWGVYENYVLRQTFICRAADGQYTRVNGDIFDLDTVSDAMRINPVHVLELEPEQLKAWRERLAADGLTQPLCQLAEELHYDTDDTPADSGFMPDYDEYDIRILKGFDRDDCSDENRYRLERLGRLLGVSGKELFLDIYYNGHRCLKERVFYPLSCQNGDPDMDVIVRKVLHKPQHHAYPWLILALERNKNTYWLNELYKHLRYCIKKRIPNAFGARGLLHADLGKYYDIARDTFILYWEDGLSTDMGIYAFESDAHSAVKDLLPYIIAITPQTAEKAEDISLYSMIQAAYRKLTPSEFYDAFKPVFDNPITRPDFVKAFMSRVKYDWNKRDLWMELNVDVPVKQLLVLDERWYEDFLQTGLSDFIVHSVTQDMPMEPMTRVFNQLLERDFERLEDLDAFYKYALGMSAMGHKDFLYDMLARVKTLMPALPYDHETLKRLAYHMEREATAFGDEHWLQQFILLDPTGFAGVFEAMRETASDDDREQIDRILKAIYEIVYRN